MNKELVKFIRETFLFNNADTETVTKIIESYDFSVCEFSKGETIFSPDNFQKKIGFIIDGECRVERPREDGASVFLNTLHKHDSFGIIAALSSGAEYPTHITASKNATVLFLNGDDLSEMIKSYPEISMNVISFLTSRISFLNKKVTTFSGKSTLQKLAAYLLAKYRDEGDTVKTSKTKLSCELGIGRASVYRDLDILEEKTFIEIQAKEIIIKCPEGLERI